MPIIQPADLLATALGNATQRKTDVAVSELSKSTLWRRARARPSRREKAANQQCLTPREENALFDYIPRMSERDYPLPVKFLRSLALVIVPLHSRSLPPATVFDHLARIGRKPSANVI